MLRSIHVPHPDRRTIAVVSIGLVALLLALAVTIDPRGTQPRAGDASAGTSTPATGAALDEPGVANELSGKASGTLGLVDAAGDPGVAADDAAAVDTAVASPALEGDVPAAAGRAADVASSSSTLAMPALDTKIVRTGSITLRTKRANFEDAWSDAQAVATGHGGYIVAASRSGAGDSARIGTITMRVPTGRFEDAVDRLRGLDHVSVRGLDISSQDVTQEYVDTKSRLRHDRAVESRLITLLAKANTVSEVLAVQSRLDSVQEQIEVARGRLQYLDKLTAMSTIEVALRAPRAAGDTKQQAQDDPSVLGEALRDASDRFNANVASAIVWLGGALPALVMLLVAAIVGRIAWRRYDRNSHATPAKED